MCLEQTAYLEKLMIDPILISIGPIAIRWYGLVYAITLGIFYWILHKKRQKLGITEYQIDTLLIYTIVGMILGARTVHMIVSQTSDFIQNPLSFFFIWQGGLSFYGAVFGMCLAYYIFYKNNHKKHSQTKYLQILDLATLVGACGLVFGRLANFINQELPGRLSSIDWCVTYETIAGCRHPYVLYAAISHAILAIILLYMYTKHKQSNGYIAGYFFIGYAILRILTDFFREDQIIVAGLTVWQILSLFCMVGGIWYIQKLRQINKDIQTVGGKHHDSTFRRI
jgi:phosphatidylglycerol---prolipoprotein diacylglyceryl transferase